ncbi:ABC transporter permease [Helicobacter saguini]|uniref:ABC transporter permease n=1 Tax=Helicobacter saguini TaxID=1548018 RepID=A0A347VQV2_9HELI|nr:ABC transporter permease [Helicobacter saguini]MWV63145.1 ABC transporter permease [Helicobacter saguini]MWV66185.1 ABC transporter permease [Helicobacter saguini]MWV68534.1 ABC transporter permease [Helicobacter saguini]MWV71911.1 ABC transporter permease [Helicobacter saguini]TLD95925.1 ABC transporter permease [Helicobacter saguini]
MLHNLKLFIQKNLFFCIIWSVLPVFLGSLAYSIFFHSIPTNLPVGIIDNDRTTLSNDLAFYIESSPALSVKKYYNSLMEAKRDLDDGVIFGVALIPQNFQANVRKGVGSDVGIYYNAQFVLIGKSINSAFLQILTTFNAVSYVGKNLATDANMNIAKAKAMPIIPKIQALFNPKNDYAQFLLTIILPCMWQILVAIGMLNLLNETPKSLREIAAKFALNIALAVAWGCVMMGFFGALHYPHEGNMSIVILAMAVYAGAMSSLVICFQAILRESAKSISVIAAYSAPALAFAGITYPQNSMEIFASFWSQILPISYFMKLYLQQANYGLDSIYSLKIIANLLPFYLFLGLGLCVYYLRIGKDSMIRI